MSQATKPKQSFSLGLDWVTMFASQIVDFGATAGSKNGTKTKGKVFKNPLKNFKFNFKLPKVANVADTLKKHPIKASLGVLVLVILALLAYAVARDGKSSIPVLSGTQ